LARQLETARTLFVVSSKSGTTTETLAFFRFFWQRASASLPDPGRRFVAVTDPGSPLERLGRERGFRAVFLGPRTVGGRFSALAVFGLVPAALLGLDLGRLLASGHTMLDGEEGLRLGAALGELARAGRDKVTFWTDSRLASFPDWIEQLVAESTGKQGQGIVPVVGEPTGEPTSYGADRVFVALELAEGGTRFGAESAAMAAVAAAGHPTVRIVLSGPSELGGEIVRWEVATAGACSVLGVNPFDQPDVQLAKELATRAMRAGPSAQEATDEVATGDLSNLAAALGVWLAPAEPRGYLGIHAYLPPDAETSAALAAAQRALHRRSGLAVTVGYGPRFLHSTGQLHKGGGVACRFLQVIDNPPADVAVPETSFSFGTLIRAQADGDRQALLQRGRSVLRVQIGKDRAAGLARLVEAIRR
jgi:transaldolase/glucose-6-phosphate isomerase